MKKKKIYKTGDVLHIEKREMATMDTFHKELESFSLMFDVLAEKQRNHQRRFWDTIYDLYPEIKEFDLYMDWKKKEITLRSKKRMEV